MILESRKKEEKEYFEKMKVLETREKEAGDGRELERKHWGEREEWE